MKDLNYTIEREAKKMTNTDKINNKGYITATQYAEIKGISKQAVYQQFDSSLKEHVIKLHGMKVVPLSILTDEEKQYFQEFQGDFQANSQEFQEENQENQEFQVNSSQENQANSQDFQAESQDFQSKIQEIQAATIDFLKQQIAEKDKQIERLTEQLDKRSEAEKQLAELVRNNQYLLGIKTIPAEATESNIRPAVEIETKEKKGIFSRFRKKKK